MGVFKLRPVYKDYLWGGEKLKSLYGKNTDMSPLAESWEVSTHPEGLSIIENGPHANKTLQSYIDAEGAGVLGLKSKEFDRFPILIKLIDAKQDLSIQVHPDDAYGLKYEHEYGKTEMWYVLEAEPDSKVYYGTNHSMTKEQFKETVEQGTLLDHLKHVSVEQGDVIFVEAGTIHAIGKGIVVCEIQQNSNTTYRVYDFNRKDGNGKFRELHIEKALEVSNFNPLFDNFTPQYPIIEKENYSKQRLVSCPYFTTTRIDLEGEMEHSTSEESFEVYVVIDGYVSISYENETLWLEKGNTCFVDASTKNIRFKGEASLIQVTL